MNPCQRPGPQVLRFSGLTGGHPSRGATPNPTHGPGAPFPLSPCHSLQPRHSPALPQPRAPPTQEAGGPAWPQPGHSGAVSGPVSPHPTLTPSPVARTHSGGAKLEELPPPGQTPRGNAAPCALPRGAKAAPPAPGSPQAAGRRALPGRAGTQGPRGQPRPRRTVAAAAKALGRAASSGRCRRRRSGGQGALRTAGSSGPRRGTGPRRREGCGEGREWEQAAPSCPVGWCRSEGSRLSAPPTHPGATCLLSGRDSPESVASSF